MARRSLRCEVLQSFKNLHRARCYVFEGDDVALEKARHEINRYYKERKGETDSEKIKEQIKFAYEVIHELKSNVVQLREVERGRFRIRLRPEVFEDGCCGGKSFEEK